MNKKKHKSKIQICEDTVRELHSYGVPSDRIVHVMMDVRSILDQGTGLMWGQIQDVINDVYDKNVEADQ
jgi:hypothetical protein